MATDTQIYYGFFVNSETLLKGMQKIYNTDDFCFFRLPKPDEIRCIKQQHDIDLCVGCVKGELKDEPYLFGFRVMEIRNGRVIDPITTINDNVLESLLFTLTFLIDKEPTLFKIKNKRKFT